MWKIISREEWEALPPKGELPPQTGPQVTFYSQIAKTHWCKDVHSCKKVVKDLQKKHMDMGYPDIQYNFLMGADGNIYEGVGWNKRIADLVSDEMDRHDKIILGFIGVPNETRYRRRMEQGKERFFTYGVDNKYLKLGQRFSYPYTIFF